MAEEEKPSLRKRFRIATFSASEDSPTPVVETPVGSPSVAFQQAVVPPRTPGANKPETENKEERGLLRRARGVKRRGDNEEEVESKDAKENSFTKDDDSSEANHRRVRKRVRATEVNTDEVAADDPNTVVRVRAPRERTPSRSSTRIDAKRQRRKDGRDSGRRRTPVLTEAEFLARRESVDRVMVVRQNLDRIQIAVLEDNMLVEHYVSRGQSASLIGNVYLGKVQNVLPSMEAAFIDIGRGRNGVLYAGEVNWDAAGLDGQPKRIELALKTNDSVLVQVTKDPVGQKGARLTSQISLPGRYLVYVPDGSVTGISRKLPDVERTRLKRILRNIVPEGAGVIVRTAAEGATEEQLQKDVARLQAQWENIQNKTKDSNPASLLYSEPDLAIRVVRDIFNEDFKKLIVAGNEAWDTIEEYVKYVAPDLADRLEKWNGEGDVFAANRIDEQISKALDRKVYLPSGGSLVIDRTEAMTVIDVNTGKFIGKGGNLEETVTKNNLEAAEEIARQLRLRDMGGIIVIDFIDMTLESNRELVLRRLVECLGRDRTKHQVAEVTSLGLVQMTRKRVGQGLIEAFSTTCESCGGRGIHIHSDPVKKVALEKDMEQRFSKTSKSASDDDDEDDLDDKSETSIDTESISTDEEVEQTPPAPAVRRKGRRAVSTGVISTN